MSDMQNLLEYILETSDQEDPKYGKVAEVQVQWEPGLTATGGVLRRHESLTGFYCLASVGQAQADGGEFRAGERLLLEQTFHASAVQRVTRTFAQSAIQIAGADQMPKASPS